MNAKYFNKTFFKFVRLFQLTVFILGAVSLSAQERIDPNTIQVGAGILWETPIGDTVKGTPHLQASSAVLVGESGSVKSFFMTGTPLWDFDARGTAVPHIARSYEAASYLCNSEGIFMAINRVGRELWRLDLGTPVSYSPVVGWDGRVFIPVASTLTCRTASGNALWTLDLGSPISFAPILDRMGSVATVLQNLDFVKVDQFSNLDRLRLERLPVIIVSLLEENQQSYVLFYESGEMDKIIFNSDAAGNRLSRSRFGSLPAPPASAASRGALFAVTLRNGRTICFNAEGGTVWTRNSHEASEERGSGNVALEQANMIWDERGIYSITIRGVSSFTDEGRRRFVFRLSTVSSGVPGFSDEGLLYACGTDNVLRVYKIDSKPRTVVQSRYYGPEPEGNYGMGDPPPSPWAGERNRYTEENQNAAYAEIEAAIRSGNIGVNEPAYVAYIMEMVGFFIGNPQASQVRPLVRPEERIKLIGLLALVGSRETIPFLWNIFDRDPEPAVRRACADAIGVIGVDPTGRSFYSYQFLLSPNNPNIDPQLVLAAASSIANLCRFSGPPLASDGIRILRYFTNMPTLPNRVKAQIQSELDGLFRDGLDQPLN
jgi:outer membrane protein assembly factor BamB